MTSFQQNIATVKLIVDRINTRPFLGLIIMTRFFAVCSYNLKFEKKIDFQKKKIS